MWREAQSSHFLVLHTLEESHELLVGLSIMKIGYTRVRLPSKPAHEPSNGPKLPVCAVCAVVLKMLRLYEYDNP